MKLGQNIPASAQRPANLAQPSPAKASPGAAQRSFQELLSAQKGTAGELKTEAGAPAAKTDAAGALSTLQLASKGAAQVRAGT